MIQPLQGKKKWPQTRRYFKITIELVTFLIPQLQKGCWLDLGSNKKELKYTKKPSSFLWLVIHVDCVIPRSSGGWWTSSGTSQATPRSITCLRIAVVYPRTSSELVYPLPQNLSQSKIPRKKKKKCLCSHHIAGNFPGNSPENSRGLALLRQHLLQKAQDPQLELWAIGTNRPWSGISSPVPHEFWGGGLCFLKPEDIYVHNIYIYNYIYLFIYFYFIFFHLFLLSFLILFIY